jgi:phage terminase large subunit-like protein
MITTKYTKKDVTLWLNELDYEFKGYMPTADALLFVNFIKEVNGGSEENETPLVHLKMMDGVFNAEKRCAVLCHRGIGKTTLFAEYLILFIAAFGYFPGFGDTSLVLYVTDSIENGVKNLRRNVEYRFNESEFLQQLIPDRKIGIGTNSTNYVGIDEYEVSSAAGRKFTDVRLEFVNNNGHVLVVKGYGAKTGVRGAKEMGKRANIAILDDLVSDTDAESETVINTIENTVYKAVSKALHPTKQKIVWLGTPFNARDPLYKAVESGAWQVSVYPICEEFPVSEAAFRGSWADRFPYVYVLDEYNEAQALGKPENFNQELMLRIMSDEDRLVADSEIPTYSRSQILLNRHRFNFYITTDFATSEKQKSDWSVIGVWAVNHKGYLFLVDGICKKQLMNKNIDDLFRLSQIYQPLQVGIEVSGQQKGFIPWLQSEMLNRNCFFSLASDGNDGDPGIKPNTNKMVRFNIVLPWFKAMMMYFPNDMQEDNLIIETKNELSLASKGGFKSKKDDCIDMISMLGSLTIWRPSEETEITQKENDMWVMDIEEERTSRMASYVV